MAEEQKQTCNRTPFETTSSCDRGSVDIYTFSNLPICKVIDPPTPLVGPPAVDFPVIPFTPPPCACINIKTAASGKMEDRKDLKFETTFKATGGDCCQGNYSEKFEIKIPCIAFSINGGEQNTNVTIEETGCGENTTPTGTFNPGIKKSPNGCVLNVNPTLKLKLPKHPTYNFATSFSIDTVCGLDSATGTFVFDTTGTDCDKNIKAVLNLKVPKPPEYTFNTEFNIDAECGLDKPYGTFTIDPTPNECGTDFTANLDLMVPKPRTYTFEHSGTIEKVCYGQSFAGSFHQEVTGDGCSNTVTTRLNLKVPCIMFDLGGKYNQDVKINIQQGKNVTGNFNLGAKINQCCELTFNPTLNLTLPNIDSQKIYEFGSPQFVLNTGCGTGAATGAFLFNTRTTGGTTVVKPRLELTIPTPPTYEVRTHIGFISGKHSWDTVNHDYREENQGCKIILHEYFDMKVPHVANITLCKKAGGTDGVGGQFGFNLHDSMFTLSGGIDGSGSFTLGAEEDDFGFVTHLCPSLKLNMPCPLKKLKLIGDSPEEPYNKAYVKVKKETASSSGCAAKWSVKLSLPEGAYTGVIKFLTGFTFTGNKFDPKIGVLNFKDGILVDPDDELQQDPKISVQFAEHQCC